MRIIGIDPASTSGWSLLEDGKLVEFGQIVCPRSFTLPQQLNLYHIEIQRLVERLKPDYCAIEDAILALSGVKTLVKLARINGVCIQSAFNVLKDRVTIYEPTFWKANSLDKLNGQSPKWKIQLEVARHFGLSVAGDFNKWDIHEKEVKEKISKVRNGNHDRKGQIDKLKAALARKRNPIVGNDRVDHENKIKILEREHKTSKQELKKLEKEASKELSSIGNDIYSQTGLSPDIADSICIAYCLHKGNRYG